MYDAAILVPRTSGEQVIRELAMKLSADGFADTQLPWTGLERRKNKPDGWWLAAGAFFDGQVLKFNPEYGELGEPERVEVTEADASLCVFDGRLLAVVKPASSPTQPAIWIGENAGQITIETGGSQGLGGRPVEVTLKTDDWTLKLVEVARVFRRWTQGTNIDETLQTGQEKSLVKVLGDVVGVEQRFPMKRLDPGSLSDAGSYQWQRPIELQGLWRLYRSGQPSVITWPVDRSRSDDEQATDLEAIDWLPPGIHKMMLEQVRGQRDRTKLWFPELPPGRLQAPYPGISPVASVEGGDPPHPARDYLWPAITDEGIPILGPGETIVHEWAPPAIQINYFTSTAPNGPGRITTITAEEYMLYLTEQRMIQVSRLDPSAKGYDSTKPWSVGHLHWDWVSSIGNLRRQYLKRAGFLGSKEQIKEEVEGLFVRETFPNTSFCEFWFPAKLGSAGPISDLITTIEGLISQSPTREIGVAEEDIDLNEFTQRRIRMTTPISGAVPYSIPERLS